MKIADLYIRVSTDEQADKGYSQRSQREVLERYCEQYRIEIGQVIFEDHSAKTFNRPKWKQMLDRYKKKKNRPDLVLFTKWDRFSRNAPDAYMMIALLNSFEIDPQAIEQPLDMSVPENKMMLAIYLTAPEIENDRRALNVIYGMRRAKKEGRWVSMAPVGYINKSTENGKKYIAVKEPEASFMRKAFNEIATGRYSTEQIIKKLRAEGFGCGKNRILEAIRNPVYCGLIFIPKFKEEDAQLVKGLHEPLISQTLFYEVQDCLDGRKRNAPKTKISSRDALPLHGFLICSKCKRNLCGSASKGRYKYYHYYHCSSSCGCRYKAEDVNAIFLKYLSSFNFNMEFAELIKQILREKYFEDSGTAIKKQCISQITELNHRVTRARELLLNGDIQSEEYREIKQTAEQKIMLLEEQIEGQKEIKFIDFNAVESLLETALERMTSLDTLYNQSCVEDQRRLIGSMFPEKLRFEELQHRTTLPSELYQDIYLINKELRSKKNRENEKKFHLPGKVGPAGLEPATKRL